MDKKPIIMSNNIHGPDSKEESSYNLKVVENSVTQSCKLVVPTSMRSIYWKYYGFPARSDGSIITRQKIVCLLCKTQIAYNRNTSNLRMHLQNKHSQELGALEATTPPKRPFISQESKEKRAQKRILKQTIAPSQYLYATSSNGVIQIDVSGIEEEGLQEQIQQIKFESPVKVVIKEEANASNSGSQSYDFIVPETNEVHNANMDSKTMSNLFANLLIADLHLADIVEGQGFHSLIANLRSVVEFPDKTKMESEILPQIYDSVRRELAGTLACVTRDVGLTMEEWKSNCGQSFVTFSIFYQQPDDAVLESKVLSTLHAPAQWKEAQWSSALDRVLLQWSIDVERITAVVVASQRAEIFSALSGRGLTAVPCFLQTLKTCAQVCFDIPEIDTVISKCRNMIGTIASSPEISESLVLQEQMFEIEQSPLIMDYPPVWTSTYNMLEQILFRRNILPSIFENMSDADQEYLELSTDEWSILEDVINVLEPFKVTLVTLSEEKIPLVSLVRPLLWQLVSSHLKTKESDSQTTITLKESLSTMLSDCYSDPNVMILLQITTTLDPRFKQFPHTSEEDKKDIITSVKKILSKRIQNEVIESKEKNEEEPALKRKRSGMELLLGDMYNTKSKIPAEEKANLELSQYQAEPMANLDSCPLQWWTKISVKCPNLGKLVRKYNCVPVSCTPPHRMSADGQFAYDAKRANLPLHVVDKLLFLNANNNGFPDLDV